MVLGFDFGMKYIGVATGQSVTQTATPLICLQAKDGIPDWRQMDQLITDWQPNELVVGSPMLKDKSTSNIAKCAQKFANRLRQKYKLPVHVVDEHLTTWEAKQQLLSHSAHLRATELALINAKAAVIILEQWLRNQ